MDTIKNLSRTYLDSIWIQFRYPSIQRLSHKTYPKPNYSYRKIDSITYLCLRRGHLNARPSTTSGTSVASTAATRASATSRRPTASWLNRAEDQSRWFNSTVKSLLERGTWKEASHDRLDRARHREGPRRQVHGPGERPGEPGRRAISRTRISSRKRPSSRTSISSQ